MRKRSKYRPRELNRNPLGMLRRVEQADLELAMAQNYAALDTLTRGNEPDLPAWRILVDTVNAVIALTMSFGKLVPDEVMPAAEEATAALARAQQRYTAGQALRLDAQGIQAIRETLEVYRQAAEGLTQAEISQAISLVQDTTLRILKRGGKNHQGKEIVTL